MPLTGHSGFPGVLHVSPDALRVTEWTRLAGHTPVSAHPLTDRWDPGYFRVFSYHSTSHTSHVNFNASSDSLGSLIDRASNFFHCSKRDKTQQFSVHVRPYYHC